MSYFERFFYFYNDVLTRVFCWVRLTSLCTTHKSCFFVPTKKLKTYYLIDLKNTSHLSVVKRNLSTFKVLHSPIKEIFDL